MNTKTSPVTTDTLVKMPGGFSVPQPLLNAVRLQAEERIPLLDPGVQYRAKDLLGKRYCEALTKPQHLQAGRCVAFLTLKDQLPLVERGRGKDNHKRYVLK